MTSHIRIMVYRHSAFYSPLISAVAAGFLKQEGLEPEYRVKPKERDLYDMFRRREVDVMQAAVSTSWDALSKGVRDIPVHFAQINQRDGFFLVRRSLGGSFSWKDLEGATLLADHGQQPLAMLKYALWRQHVDWKSIEIIDAGVPEKMMDAFRNGTGDYVHLQGPAAQQLEVEGFGEIAAAVGDANPPVAFSSLMANRDFLETSTAAAFMNAYRRSLDYVIESPAGVVAAAQSSFFPGVASDALVAAIARYQKLGTWRRDAAITKDQYEVALDVFMFNGIIPSRFPYEDVVVPPPTARVRTP
jgi:NitT/TauT family transport system substrate-binding protein